MHDLALEAIQSLNIRVMRLVQLTNGRDEEIGLNCVAWAELRVLAARDLDVDLPLASCIIPCCGFDGSVKPDVLVEVVFAGNIAEIVLLETR